MSLTHSLTCKTCALKDLCHDLELDTQEKKQFSDVLSSTKVIQKGEALYQENEKTNALYAIRNGSVKITNQNGKILQFFLAGDFLGLDAFNDQHHKVNAIAIEQTTVCAYDLSSMMSLLSKVPKFNHYFLKTLSHQLNQQYNSFNHHLNAKQRLCSLINKISDHYSLRGFSATEFTLSMKRQDIANYLDLAAETISRTIHQLEDEHILTLNNKTINILNLSKLKEMC